MEESKKSILEKVIRLTRLSEKKFKVGDFKGSLEERKKASLILKSNFIDEEIVEKFKEELSNMYFFKFDLIQDHKLRINEEKKYEIIKLLEQKCEEKLKNGDYRGAVKALRRSEKYLSK